MARFSRGRLESNDVAHLSRDSMPRNRRPLSVEDLWAIKRIGTPTLSPDGRTACAPVTIYDMETNEGTTELWLFSTDGRKSRRLTAGDKETQAVWSPDGQCIAFAAKRKDDEEPQVYLIAPDGGEARRLTSIATGALGLRWFPDSRRIAFISWVWPDLRTDREQAKRKKERKEAKVKAHLSERKEYRFWDHWLTDGREPHVFAADVAGGHARDLLAGTGLALQPWASASLMPSAVASLRAISSPEQVSRCSRGSHPRSTTTFRRTDASSR